MKIFILSRGYPTEYDPTWGCFERDHALMLKKHGHEVVVFSVDKRFRIRGHWGINHRISDGIDIYDCRIFPSRLLSSRFPRLLICLYSLFCLWTFEKAIKKNGIPDVIFSHFLANTTLLKRIKKKYKVPIVAMEHWSMLLEEPRPKFVDVYANNGYPLADRILSVSKALQQQLKSLYNVDSIVVNNIISPEFEIINRKQHEHFTFVSIGSLLVRKGYDVLLKAFAKSGLINHGVQLIIVGQDEGEASHLIEMTNSLSLSNNVNFVGQKTKQEISDILSRSDGFVLSSRSETFGVVYIEAMMFGLPVIGTRCGGPEEIIDETNGILVDVDSIDQLSNAMNYMYSNIQKYNNSVISSSCIQKYSPDVIYEQIIASMKDVINNYNK